MYRTASLTDCLFNDLQSPAQIPANRFGFLSGRQRWWSRLSGLDTTWHIRVYLSHLPLDKMATISQATFTTAFLEWNILYFDSNFTKFVPKDLVDKQSALVQVMAWRRTDDFIYMGCIVLDEIYAGFLCNNYDFFMIFFFNFPLK